MPRQHYFSPKFSDMSDLELERAAMAPRRWIELCGRFRMQNYSDFGETPRPRTTRFIDDASKFNSLFIVPGGRYLVSAGWGIFVWDLGYDSTVDCKLVACARVEYDFALFTVQATPDGKGLVILSCYINDRLSIFEIYPQSEIPLLTQIASISWLPSEENPAHLLPDTLICRAFHEDSIIAFRVVDYRTNYSTCFSADVNIRSEVPVETFATKTAIFVFCKEGIFIWAIPPLSPQLSDFSDHFLDDNPSHIPPLLKIPFPGGTVRHTHEIRNWITISSWYFGSESLYFDTFYTDSKVQKFKIIIKPDLSDTSLHAINMSEIISSDFMNSLDAFGACHGYRICEDALVYFLNNMSKPATGIILTSAPFTNAVTRLNEYIHDLCPTSGRYVYCDRDSGSYISNKKIVVVDLL